MSTNEDIRVLLVGGNQATTDQLRETLDRRAGIMVAGEIVSVDEVLGAAGEVSPDVILMQSETTPTGRDNIDVARTVSQAKVPASIIIMTEDIIRNLVPAIKAGASGLLSPQTPPEDLASAIRRIHLWSLSSRSLQ